MEDPASKEHAFRLQILVLLACVIAGSAAYTASHLAFCRAPPTTDENCYVFQANSILDGRLFRPYPGMFSGALNQKQIIFIPRKGMVSRYAPGHALWLLPGVILGDPFIMSAIGAALVLLMLVKCGALLDVPRAAIIVFLLCSPHFIMTFGTLLSHTSGLMASSLMLLSYVLWRKTGLIKFAIFAGLAWGWLFHNRTLTAICFVVPFGADALFQMWRRPEKKPLSGVLAFAVTSVICATLLFAYNYILTGQVLGMTHSAYDPSEAMGFGPRHTKGITIHHDFANGLRNLRDNLVHLDLWLFGFRGSLVVAVSLALIGWNWTWTPLLAGVYTATWLGYIFFWYPGPQETGPGYYLETLPFLCVASGMGVGRIWSLSKRLPRQRAVVAILCTALLAAAAGRFMIKSGRELREFLLDRGLMLACCRSAPPDSLIFFEHSAIEDYMINNPRGVDSDPLMIRTFPGVDKTVIKYFTGRSYFYLRQNGLSFHLEPAATNLVLDVSIPAFSMAYHTGSNVREGNKNLRRAESLTHDKGWLAFGRNVPLFPGRFVISYDMDISDCTDDEYACVLDAATDSGNIILAEKKIFGSPSSDVLTMEFVVDDFMSVEARVYYSGCGSLAFRAIRITEVAE